MATNSFSKLSLRRSTSENLAIVDPILEDGEPLYETDTGKMKIGDGIHRYSELPYVGKTVSPDIPPEDETSTDINSKTPTYTIPDDMDELISGEQMTTAMGKIARAIKTLISHTSYEEDNPHHVTKEQVGLGNVPNVTTNNQAPTYTVAANDEELISGESLSNAFSKIAKSIKSFISHKNNTSNPHGTTKAQVGLGNVPNVTTNNQTPTYTISGNNEELVSGENVSTAFGKIAKAVKTLIAHITNVGNPHGTTKAQVGLGNVDNTADINKNVASANKVNQSVTVKLNSGTIEGTNKITFDGSSAKELNITAAKVGASTINHKHSADDINGGVLPVENGGTGVADIVNFITNNNIAKTDFSNVAETVLNSLKDISIEHGSYVGTATQSNIGRKSFTFDREPLFLLITGRESAAIMTKKVCIRLEYSAATVSGGISDQATTIQTIVGTGRADKSGYEYGPTVSFDIAYISSLYSIMKSGKGYDYYAGFLKEEQSDETN